MRHQFLGPLNWQTLCLRDGMKTNGHLQAAVSGASWTSFCPKWSAIMSVTIWQFIWAAPLQTFRGVTLPPYCYLLSEGSSRRAFRDVLPLQWVRFSKSCGWFELTSGEPRCCLSNDHSVSWLPLKCRAQRRSPPEIDWHGEADRDLTVRTQWWGSGCVPRRIMCRNEAGSCLSESYLEKDFWCLQCFVTHLKRQHFIWTQSKFIWRYDLLFLSVLDIADIGFIIFSVDLNTKSIFPTKCNVMKNVWNVSASSLLLKKMEV